MKLLTIGKSKGRAGTCIAKCTFSHRTPSERADWVFLSSGPVNNLNEYDGYAALITTDTIQNSNTESMIILEHIESIDHLKEGDVVRINGVTGQMKTLYRVNSKHNVLFMTDNCNSHCLMCSQPPKKKDDSYLIKENRRLIKLIEKNTEYLGISGGEPTLLKDNLFEIVKDLKDFLPDTNITMLSNGRMFYYQSFSEKFAKIDHRRFVTAIPLYSDVPEFHDNVVQSPNAFSETMRGLYNLGKLNQRIEIRVVLHALTYKRLPQLAEFIYRNLPFVEHIALMGLEVIGYAKKNLKELWIDPYDYQEELSKAVEYLSIRGMNVSIYNHQLCVLPKHLWAFNKKSISDWKNIYLDECSKCSVLEQCGGLFKWMAIQHSEHIHPL